MLLEAIRQYLAMPVWDGNLGRTGSDSLPERIHVVYLFGNAQVIETGWWLGHAHPCRFGGTCKNAYLTTLKCAMLEQHLKESLGAPTWTVK